MAPDVSRFPQGVWVSVPDLTAARPVGAIVLNALDSELYMSTNASVATYTALTGGGGGGGAQQLPEQFFVDAAEATDASVRRYATLTEAFAAMAALAVPAAEVVLAGGTYAWGLAEVLPTVPVLIISGLSRHATVITFANNAAVTLDGTNIVFRDLAASIARVEFDTVNCTFENCGLSISDVVESTNNAQFVFQRSSSVGRYDSPAGDLVIDASGSEFRYFSITDATPMMRADATASLAFDRCTLECASVETTTVFVNLAVMNVTNSTILLETVTGETLSLYSGAGTAVVLSDARFAFAAATSAAYDFVSSGAYTVDGAVLYIDTTRVTSPPTGAWIVSAGAVIVVP